MNYAFSILLIAIIIASISTVCFTKDKLIVGDAAPDFSLVDTNGKEYNLSELHGKKVALVFYPKDNSPGCTKEVCSIRNEYDQLHDKNIIILGISKGSIKNKTSFIKEHNLPFPLLTATDDVLEKYGVKGYFLTLFMPKRRTFLINEKGIIINIIKDINVNNHAQQIINGFEQI